MLLRLRESGRRPLAGAVRLNLSGMVDDDTSLQNSQTKTFLRISQSCKPMICLPEQADWSTHKSRFLVPPKT